MKDYIGKKKVKAAPMDEATAVENGFARKNEDNHEWRHGYHVRYTNPDGSTYDSWSPKSVFEEAYKPADTVLDRLRIEADELSERLHTLDTFLIKGYDHVAETTGGKQASLLLAQGIAMNTYLKLLQARIKNLEHLNGSDKEQPLTAPIHDIQTTISQIKEWQNEDEEKRAALIIAADEGGDINAMIMGRADILVGSVIRAMLSEKEYKQFFLNCTKIYQKIIEEKEAEDENKTDPEQQP